MTMNNEQEPVFPRVEFSINGEVFKPENLSDLILDLEFALQKADVIDYDDSLEILSKEASAVASKCGY